MPDTFGQHDVEQHEVGLDGVEQLERLGAVAGDLHPEALALEADGQRVDEGLLVLDHQDGGRRASVIRLLPRCRVTAPTGPGPAGQPQRERRALALARTRRGTSPPWLAATWRTMASPRPVPPVSRLRARSTR